MAGEQMAGEEKAGEEVAAACTNPAALGGGRGNGCSAPPKPWATPEQPIKTTCVCLPGLLSAETGRCKPTGLYLIDVQVALGNLLDIVGQQAKADLAKQAGK
jgi:hypothetical protein